ncbi:MAG: hypothetical protein IKF99_15590 [Oscillospiraceae bacterium]|nr:hypothetical protein [Oscillospiraceae bacterium]MBR3239845.1 hypothetical protein [Oscillospiraceae bacterium]
MRGTVTIGNKEVEMAANAATPFIYKQTFHEDLLVQLQAKDPSPDLFLKVGYIMAKQAELPTSELMKMTDSGFIAWAAGFEFMDIVNATGDIAALYTHQTEKTSVPKEKAD